MQLITMIISEINYAQQNVVNLLVYHFLGGHALGNRMGSMGVDLLSYAY